MSKKIPLSGKHGKGKYAIVDDEDYEWLMQWKWSYKKGYARRGVRYGKRVDNKTYSVLMHRELNKTPTDMDTDHIDGNRLNNQKSNLRNCSKGENNMNRPARKEADSKYKGIKLIKDGRKRPWIARITKEGRHYHLGCYETKELAAIAYNIMAKILFGEFAYLNEIGEGK